MRLVLVGPPGAGKGTQAEFVAAHYGVEKLSTGDIFRANVSGGTELGQLAKKYMDDGDLVPDEVTNAMVRDRLSQPELAPGFLLDGFPRNVAQAYELDAILGDLGTTLDVVLELVVDAEEVVRRLSGRRTCRNCGHIVHVDIDDGGLEGGATADPPASCDKCGGELFLRDDDKAQTVRHRLDVYAEQTSPLVAFYAGRGQLVGIDAIGAVEEVTARAITALQPFVR